MFQKSSVTKLVKEKESILSSFLETQSKLSDLAQKQDQHHQSLDEQINTLKQEQVEVEKEIESTNKLLSNFRKLLE